MESQGAPSYKPSITTAGGRKEAAVAVAAVGGPNKDRMVLGNQRHSASSCAKEFILSCCLSLNILHLLERIYY